ncbi:hypothetical protein OGAPHI_000213 [Ogataea philodendri]|uniref:Major facilitator superfamily (MFS) profile domain-containing protein n=1 Tax=Ogataea philodendri TaxID=1378263 RepID=A0A9P8TAM8_9ASCO|nr:uncharacterized protein OGAPHI_000213 [Ogataea philodendri]KAH3671510.1 hypothetical protein OGAPHI_000213 [Ogataea philodendri]
MLPEITYAPPIPMDEPPAKQETTDDSSEEEAIGSPWPIILFSTLIATGGLIFGYDIGTIGGMIDMPAFTSTFGDNTTGTQPAFYSITKGALIGISSMGGFVGGILSILLITPFGLRPTIFSAGLIYAVGNLITFTAKVWVQVMFGRALNGMANGIVCVTCPMLISELAPTNMRGGMICIQQLLTTVGIQIGSVTMYLSQMYFDNTSSLQYQVPLLEGIVWALATCALIWVVPESPYWYLTSRKLVEKSKASVARARSLGVNDPGVLRIVAIMFNNNSDEDEDAANREKRSIRKGQPKYLLRTLTGISVLCCQQLTGINYFFFFGTTIFATIGLTNPYLVPIFFGFVNLIFSVVSLFIIERFNRTTLLMSGSVLLVSFMLIFTTVSLVSVNNMNVVSGVLMVTVSCGFIGVFATTWGPLSGVVVSELYPISIKVKAMSICGSASWLVTFVMTLITPPLTELFGFGIGFVFVFFNALGFALVYYLVPETKGMPLERLDELYEQQ